MDDNYYSPKELKGMLKVKTSDLIIRWINDGIIPGSKLASRTYGIPKNMFKDLFGDPADLIVVRANEIKGITESERIQSYFHNKILKSYPGSVKIGSRWFCKKEFFKNIEDRIMGPLALIEKEKKTATRIKRLSKRINDLTVQIHGLSKSLKGIKNER